MTIFFSKSTRRPLRWTSSVLGCFLSRARDAADKETPTMTTDAIRITLTTAQRSALECFEPDEDDAIAWAELNFDGRRVTATPAAYSLIFEASNIEGEAAEYWSRRGETDLARQARGASEALHNLCKKMRLRCPASFSLRAIGG